MVGGGGGWGCTGTVETEDVKVCGLDGGVAYVLTDVAVAAED